MNIYGIYGLRIKSNVDINFLKDKKLKNHSTAEVDVEIENGKIPEDKLIFLSDNKWFHYSKNLTCFRIFNEGIFVIENGNKIIYESFHSSNENIINTFLLGTSMGILLEQRNRVAIHGSSIIINNKAFIITGANGAGKSSLSKYFQNLGYEFLSDDISVIGSKDNKIYVHSSYHQQKICSDTMEYFGYDKNEYELLDKDVEKYLIKNFKGSEKEWIELGYICEIVINNDIEEPFIEEIKGIEKLDLVVNNIFRGEIFFGRNTSKEYFDLLLKIVRQSKSYRINRPSKKFTMEEQLKLIKNIII